VRAEQGDDRIALRQRQGGHPGLVGLVLQSGAPRR
jgi:hypothetical protein